MSKNFDDLIKKLRKVMEEKNSDDPEYKEIINKILELKVDDRNKLLQKLGEQSDGMMLKKEIHKLLKDKQDLVEKSKPWYPTPAPAEEDSLAGDPTTDPDEEF